MSKWLYDESKHCGVDYSKATQAEVYDARHERFRDYEREFRRMLAFLELQNPKDKTIVDLGCGTGAIAVFAASVFKAVYAVDISDVMLEKARAKLEGEVTNLEFLSGGFLSYRHRGGLVDVVATKAALHHLPDFWQQVALLRINGMLKMGGWLYLNDIVFQFEPHEYACRIDSWLAGFGRVAGEEFRLEVETHVREEYSTFGWIMQGMLERSGFALEKCESYDDFVTEYACRKVSEVNWEDPA